MKRRIEQFKIRGKRIREARLKWVHNGKKMLKEVTEK